LEIQFSDEKLKVAEAIGGRT